MSTDSNVGDEPADLAASAAGVDALPDDLAALGKVRELLFGTQARETSARLEAIEQRLAEAVARVERDLGDRMEQLGGRLDQGLEALNERLAALETGVRQQAEQNAEGIRNSADVLGTRIDEETARLRQALGETRAEIGTSLDQTRAALEASKVDRSLLSSLLTELASRVDNA